MIGHGLDRNAVDCEATDGTHSREIAVDRNIATMM